MDIYFLFSIEELFIQSYAQDEKVQDHPALKMYPGSHVVDFEKVEFDEFYLPTLKSLSDGQSPCFR